MLDMRHSFNHTIHFKQKIDFSCTSFSFFIININIINDINLLLPHYINMPEPFFLLRFGISAFQKIYMGTNTWKLVESFSINSHLITSTRL